ncbi:MAG: redoxin domain-containing protein [Chloroflexota bacterium]
MDSPSPTRATLLIMGGGMLIGLAIGALVLIGLPAAQGAAATPAGTNANNNSNFPAPIVGSPAPDFTLKNIEGRDIRLSSLNGQPILINFWATWCGPCEIEMPAIDAAYRKYRDQGFVVLAVDDDEPLADVVVFFKKHNLAFEALLDPGTKVTDLYRVRAFPTSFFVGRNGRILSMQIGTMTEKQLEGHLERILPK